MVCTSKYAKCHCKNCKRKTRLRAKPCKKSILDKCNNGIKRLFEEPLPPPLPPLNAVKQPEVCQNCGSEDILIDLHDQEKVCEDCGLYKQIYSTDYGSIVYDDEIRRSIKFYDEKILNFKEYMNIFQGNLSGITVDLIDKVKQKLDLAQQNPTKKDVLKVLKSDSKLKHNLQAVHAIYYEITGKSPIDFSKDRFDLISDVENLLKFYWKIKPRGERNYFNYRYVLYHLLKQRNYPITIEDFPELRDIKKTKKLCEDFEEFAMQTSNFY